MVQSPRVRGSGGSPRHAGEVRFFEELSVVSLARPVSVADRVLPIGARATVVAAYADGLGYEVEMFAPFHAVVTVEGGDLTA